MQYYSIGTQDQYEIGWNCVCYAPFNDVFTEFGLLKTLP